jgi:hypothetical protein
MIRVCTKKAHITCFILCATLDVHCCFFLEKVVTSSYGFFLDSFQALKIQYLRLIHNFCDRDSCNQANKDLLLLPAPFKESSWLSKPTGDMKDEGLMFKILKILINEPADSLYRFWLASCVEAFLGGADPKNQVCL